jgi:hypothetical protein
LPFLSHTAFQPQKGWAMSGSASRGGSGSAVRNKQCLRCQSIVQHGIDTTVACLFQGVTGTAGTVIVGLLLFGAFLGVLLLFCGTAASKFSVNYSSDISECIPSRSAFQKRRSVVAPCFDKYSHRRIKFSNVKVRNNDEGSCLTFSLRSSRNILENRSYSNNYEQAFGCHVLERDLHHHNNISEIFSSQNSSAISENRSYSNNYNYEQSQQTLECYLLDELELNCGGKCNSSIPQCCLLERDLHHQNNISEIFSLQSSRAIFENRSYRNNCPLLLSPLKPQSSAFDERERKKRVQALRKQINCALRMLQKRTRDKEAKHRCNRMPDHRSTSALQGGGDTLRSRGVRALLPAN